MGQMEQIGQIRRMQKFIWLVPLLPLAGAAINGIFGRWFRFPEKLIGGIAVGSVALAFLISLTAVYSYGLAERRSGLSPMSPRRPRSPGFRAAPSNRHLGRQ